MDYLVGAISLNLPWGSSQSDQHKSCREILDLKLCIFGFDMAMLKIWEKADMQAVSYLSIVDMVCLMETISHKLWGFRQGYQHRSFRGCLDLRV